MRKRFLTGCVSGAAMVWSGTCLQAAIIYSDNFDGTAGIVSGRSPDFASGSDPAGVPTAMWTSDSATSSNPDALWTAGGGTVTSRDSTFASVGSLATGADTNLITNSYLPFTPQSGTIYDFHLDIDPSSVGASGNWIGMAFAPAGLNGHPYGGGSSALSNDSPYGLLIDKGSGAVQTFGGAGTANGETSTTVTAGQFNSFDLLLNTTGTLWTETWEVNGTALAGVYSFTTNPSIGDVVFGTNKITGEVSNFSLSNPILAPVPEPASLGILCLGGLFLGRRRPAR